MVGICKTALAYAFSAVVQHTSFSCVSPVNAGVQDAKSVKKYSVVQIKQREKKALKCF